MRLEGAAEELAQQALLHIILTEDRWSEGLEELVRDERLACSILGLRHRANLAVPLDIPSCVLRLQVLLVGKPGDLVVICRVSLVGGDIDAALLLLCDGHSINEGTVHCAACGPSTDRMGWHRLVDAGHHDAITRPHLINQVVVDMDGDVLRRLALWHQLWRLLQLQDLLVSEPAAHVHHLHACTGVLARLASRRLIDSPVQEGHLDLVPTVFPAAAESSRRHVWDEVGAADDNAADGDQLLDVGGVHLPHDAVILLLQLVDLALARAQVLELGIQELQGDVPQHLIHDRNDFRREAGQVAIELLGVGVEMSALDGELDAPLLVLLAKRPPSLAQSQEVVRLGILRILFRLELLHEVVEEPLHFRLVDVSAIDVVAFSTFAALRAAWGAPAARRVVWSRNELALAPSWSLRACPWSSQPWGSQPRSSQCWSSQRRGAQW
mmetsp:Transcript_35361/g.82661  ORF Transcript_35361/g.82661 Transcript_35361/m.82661 type:complete len:439 (+) Transcript_35361:1099-2415(+)